MKVLCLDIEGGFGGSSRSLFESIRHLDRAQADVEVWCRKAGPVVERYQKLGVPLQVRSEMPHFSTLPRASRNLYGLARFAIAWRQSRTFRRDLVLAADAADVVHLNHEGLFLLARWLRRRTRTRLVMHIRTHIPQTRFATWQYRIIARNTDARVFITENEARRMAAHVGEPVAGEVIYNVATAPDAAEPHPDVPDGGLFRVAVLSNYAWVRGIDRLIDVARVLRDRQRNDIHFVIAGDMTLRGRLPGPLGPYARRAQSLSDVVQDEGLGSWFTFLGHVPNPDTVLAAAEVLAKPTREANPWGRDILEGMAAGKPVFSHGTYNRFVETGVTGILWPDFDAGQWTENLINLADDPDLLATLSSNAFSCVRDLCAPVVHTQKLMNVWRGEPTGRVMSDGL